MKFRVLEKSDELKKVVKEEGKKVAEMFVSVMYVDIDWMRNVINCALRRDSSQPTHATLQASFNFN